MSGRLVNGAVPRERLRARGDGGFSPVRLERFLRATGGGGRGCARVLASHQASQLTAVPAAVERTRIYLSRARCPSARSYKGYVGLHGNYEDSARWTELKNPHKSVEQVLKFWCDIAARCGRNRCPQGAVLLPCTRLQSLPPCA